MIDMRAHFFKDQSHVVGDHGSIVVRVASDPQESIPCVEPITDSCDLVCCESVVSIDRTQNECINICKNRGVKATICPCDGVTHHGQDCLESGIHVVHIATVLAMGVIKENVACLLCCCCL